MSQQINLLRPRSRAFDAATLWPVAGVAVVTLAMLAYLQSVVTENTRLRNMAAEGERKLAEGRANLQRLQRQKAAQGDATSLNAEIAALRPRAEAVSQIVKDIGSGSLGSSTGYTRYFRTLSSLSEDGLWITGLTIAKAGSSVSINGRALRNESVMHYARRLNESFRPYGVRFNSLEMTPESVPNPAAPGNAAPAGLATVGFKLS